MEKNGPDIRVFPPMVAVVAPLAALVLDFLVPINLGLTGSLRQMIVGAVVGLFALALAAFGARAFKAAKTNIDPRQEALVLVKTGPYRFTRNPMYLGMVLLQFSLALVFSLEWAHLFGVLVWIILDRAVVRQEEAYLAEKFGVPYIEYLSQSRRWF